VRLDAGSFLLQWAAGGLLFGWVTTRRREVSLGYGWLIRITYGLLAVGATLVLAADGRAAPAVLAGACAVAAGASLAVSVARRGAGVSGREAVRARRRARVSAMIGRDDAEPVVSGPEFPPGLDLVAPAIGFVALLVTAPGVGGSLPLTVARLLAGALLLGAVSDAMLLGHWYLVQPGLDREPIRELVTWTARVWPLDLVVYLWPPGMVQVWTGAVDDGYRGLLGWIWAVCAITTIGLVLLTRAALRERSYSAVMAATGLLYLAILTAFGMDLLPRAVLGG